MENIYLKEISAIPVLSREEEQRLAELAYNGDKKARDRLINANLRFVVKIALEYKNQGLDVDDLICEGNAGLIVAARKFNPHKGVKFITYAVWWIRQSIHKALMDSGKSVRIPQNNYKEFLNPEWNFGSLDKELEGREGECLGDSVVDERICTPEDEYVEAEMRESVENSMKRLGNREKQIINLRYGLEDGESLSLDSVGKKMGLCKERVRQLEKKAICELKELCAA